MKFIPEYSKRKLDGIYIIKNKINSKVYIGECKNFYKRYGRHLSQLKSNKHFNIKLQNFVNKYGIDSLEFDILEELPNSNSSERIDKEIEYIVKYNSINNGFNIIKDSRTMSHISTSTRKNNGKRLIGVIRDEEFCNKVKEGVREYYKNNPHKPRAKWTEERKQARREYIKAHPEKYSNRKRPSGNKINHKRGEECSFSKLTNNIVYNIKKDIYNKVPRKVIMNTYNITKYIYSDIKRGKTWKQIIYEEDKNKKE